MIWQKIKNFVGELIFPNKIKCMFCGEELNGQNSNETCNECMSTLPFIMHACPRCGVCLTDNNFGVCINCKANNYYFDTARAPLNYTDKVVDVVHLLKYENAKYLISGMVDYMADCYAAWNIVPDFVCAVPSHPSRVKQRGYNQAELLAEEFCKRFNLTYLPLCLKVKETPSQTTLSFKDRRTNLTDCFAANPIHLDKIKNKIVLVIDDVVTTGSTVSEVAKVLKKAGAQQVHVLSFAHTPAPKDEE